MRAGKPCSRGSGPPFMPMAIIASRPSSGHVERRRDRHAVDVGGEDLVGLRRVDACLREHVGEGYAEPAGAADVGAADLVGDAGEGDVALDGRHRGEVVEGQRDLLVDVAVDGQGPRVGVDGRHGEPGVDPVELPGRRAQRRDAGVLLLETDREGRRGVGGGRECDVGARRGGTTSPTGRWPPWSLRPRRGRRSPARPRVGSGPHPPTRARSGLPGRRRGAATTVRWRPRPRRPGREAGPAARSSGAGRRARRRRRRGRR